MRLLPSRRMRAGRAFALAISTLAAGCASIEQQGTKPFSAELPQAAPRTLGVETAASAEHKKMVALFGGEYHYPTAERFLNDILAKLAAAEGPSSEPYKVTILNSPVVNAFALPPNNLYVTRGLLALANDGSEVAAVMAHEIAHITARHALLRAEQEKRAAVISQAANVIQSRQRGDQVESTERRSIAGFSRQQELEADQIGIRSIGKAGYDPYGAARFLTVLERASAMRAALIGQGSSASKPDIMATHPSTPERIAQATDVAKEITTQEPGTTDRAGYLAAIDNIMFGDDPADGSIRGRVFIHPRLGFAFVAPEGFVVENSAQAVLGVKSGGLEALRLDSVRLAPSTPLTTYITSGWIDGLLQSSIETLDVNGMQAVLASARAGEWNFRVAVIRFDSNDVYRLIFAARALTDDTEKRFRESIKSFRRSTPEEANSIRPLRVSIVLAKQGDKAEGFSLKMSVLDRPLEQFLLINGLEKAGLLRAGERYKIVTE
ncbi:MAG: M48 family metalloprotease [Beijerinckiaceae bacterium]